MPYVAHAGVQVDRHSCMGLDREWHSVEASMGSDCRWRMRDDWILQVVQGVFEDRVVALMCAKRMFVNLVYRLMLNGILIATSGCTTYETRHYLEKHEEGLTREEFLEREEFFFWTPNCKGNLVGPAVLEVADGMPDVGQYPNHLLEVYVSAPGTLNLKEIDAETFPYTRDSQPLLQSLVDAHNTSDYGLRTTLFVCILEHMAEDGYKPKEVCDAVDKSIAALPTLGIGKDVVKQIENHLRGYKREGSRAKIRKLASSHARERYGKFGIKEIVEDAYNVRSAYAHGGHADPTDHEASTYIELVAMDVVASTASGQSSRQNASEQ